MKSGNVLLLYCYVLVSIFIIKYFYLIAVKYRYRYIRVTLIDPSKFFSVEVYQFLVPQAHQAQLSIFFFSSLFMFLPLVVSAIFFFSFLFRSWKFTYFYGMFACMCVCVPHKCSRIPERNVRFPGARVTDDCEPKPGPPKRSQFS